MRVSLACLLLLALALLQHCIVGAYHPGDYVDVEQRRKCTDLPGEWHELHINELPRFSYARQVRMNLIEDAEEGSKLAESSECKMQLKFARGRFSTPWILTKSHHGYLSKMVVTLRYEHNAVTSVRLTKSEYLPGTATDPKHEFSIQYVWELHGAADHDAAFSIMLGSGFLFAVISIAIVAVSTMEKYSDKIGGGADRSNRHMHDSDDSD